MPPVRKNQSLDLHMSKSGRKEPFHGIVEETNLMANAKSTSQNEPPNHTDLTSDSNCGATQVQHDQPQTDENEAFTAFLKAEQKKFAKIQRDIWNIRKKRIALQPKGDYLVSEIKNKLQQMKELMNELSE
ncbi:uncharacterized protein LOC119685980 [Teleopsis dalmanni]|uniref:uncharacterized protein LOC119685980 n=1 Tax=Teleopsis dalmanni TaxID=139649 RepID=UPI0018CD1AE0|nr:uncharacterized protein LOC119685980 [Teleopsis dalmanni]XP_037956344.1 uncharacterized protein LOC119685980 [Teleopsis dalmanni]